MTTVLVVSGGGFQGQALLEALAELPAIRVLVADVYVENVTRYLCADYFVVPPLVEQDAFVSAVLDIAHSESVNVVFAATARELRLLSSVRQSFERLGVDVAVSSSTLINILLDKGKTAAFLAEHGLPVQRSVDPAAHDFSAPLFGKPKLGWGGRGTVLASSLPDTQVDEVSGNEGDMVWFPYIETFEEYSVDFSISRSGNLSPIVVRRRIRTSGGYAVISETDESAGLAGLARSVALLLSTCGGRGIFNVQLIQPSTGAVFISDINPRFGTSAVHSLFQGVNLPKHYLQDRVDIETVVPACRMKTVRYLRTIAVPVLRERPKAVVFDLDDTLVDHKLWMAMKMEIVFEKVAQNWADRHSFRECYLRFIDEGARADLIDRISESFSWSDEQRTRLIDAYRCAVVDQTPLYSDVEPVLRDLERSGLSLALLTDNPVQTQRAKIERSPALSSISKIIFSRKVGAEKPSPLAFDYVAAELGLQPRELCMIGDNFFRDALGAVRSGYACAFVVSRRGSFVRPHRGLTGLVGSEGEQSRIYRVDSLVVARESIMAS